MNKINEKERNRLGSYGIVNTRNFKGRQSFGAASEVRHISPEEYLRYQKYQSLLDLEGTGGKEECKI